MISNEIRLSEIIAPSFHSLYAQYKKGGISEIWCKGGRGSCKSTFISLLILLELTRNPKMHAVIARRYQNELRDSVFGQMEWSASMLGISDYWTFTVSPMQGLNNKTGQKILFRAADNPMKTKSIKLKFGYIGIFWGEEIDQFGGMNEIRILRQSLLRGQGSKWLSLYSFNPPKSARSWVNIETKIKKPGRVVHHSDYRTVPKEWLGEVFISDAKHLEKINDTAYRHEYLGEEVGTGLEIFNNVTIRAITDNEIAAYDRIYQGLDFGYTIDPLAFEHFAYHNNKLYLFDEISGIGIKNRVFAEMLTTEQKADLTMADKAEPKSIDELRDDYGLNIIGAEKPPGSVEHGIKWLQDLDEIVIDPERCPLAAKEYVNYTYDLNREGDIINKYPDKNNHSIDAIRYGCVELIKQARLEKRKKPVKIDIIPTVSRW